MKKGRHRRFEEARALKRSQDVDFDALLDSLQPEGEENDHSEWADLEDDGDDD